MRRIAYCLILLFRFDKKRTSEFAHQGAPFSNTEMTMQSKYNPLGHAHSQCAVCLKKKHNHDSMNDRFGK